MRKNIFIFLTIQVIFLKLFNSELTTPGAKDHSAVNKLEKILKKKRLSGNF